MEFLKNILGDDYTAFEGKIAAYNQTEAGKASPISLANIAGGEYVKKTEFDAEVSKSASLEEQLKTALEGLGKFDGVDPDKLKDEIKTLTAAIEVQKGEYEAQIEDMKFDSYLGDAIKSAGARSVKAVMAELDINSLKVSKNRDADIQKAIADLKQREAWMFGADEPIRNPVGKTDSNVNIGGVNNALRKAMGLAPKE